MLPFLKNKHEGGMSGPVEIVERETDEGSDSFEMIDAIADDILSAVSSKNKKLLKAALEALVEHIKEEDVIQDESLTNKEI